MGHQIKTKVSQPGYKLRWKLPEAIGPTSRILIIAPSDSGKSFLLRDLVYHLHKKHNFHHAVIFSGSDGNAENSLNEHLPDSFCFRGFDPERMEHIFRHQEETVKYRKSLETASQTDGFFDTKLLVVLDDVTDDKKKLNSDIMCTLCKMGRHAQVLLAVIIHSPTDLKKEFTSNFNNVFLLKFTNGADRDKIRSLFAPRMGKAEWEKVFDLATRNYGALVIDNETLVDDPVDILRYYRACSETVHDDTLGRSISRSPHGQWRLGSDAVWDFHNRFHVSKHCRMGASSIVPAWKKQRTTSHGVHNSRGRNTSKKRTKKKDDNDDADIINRVRALIHNNKERTHAALSRSSSTSTLRYHQQQDRVIGLVNAAMNSNNIHGNVLLGPTIATRPCSPNGNNKDNDSDNYNEDDQNSNAGE